MQDLQGQDPQGQEPLWWRVQTAMQRVGPPKTSVTRRLWQHADDLGGDSSKALAFGGAMGEGLANITLQTARAANWLGYAAGFGGRGGLLQGEIPEGHIPADMDLGIPKTIHEALPEKYALRLESRLARGAKFLGHETRAGAQLLGTLPTFIGGPGIAKLFSLPHKSIGALGKPGHKLGEWMVRNVKEVGTWTKLGKDLVPASIGGATGFGLFNYLVTEGEYDERTAEAMMGMLTGLALGVTGQVGRVAEIGLLKAGATKAQKQTWRKVLEGLEQGKVDFPLWKQVAPKAVNAAIENMGFASIGHYMVDGEKKYWMEDLFAGFGGDEAAMKRALAHYAISYPGLLMAKGASPATARRNHSDIAKDAAWSSWRAGEESFAKKRKAKEAEGYEKRYGPDWQKYAGAQDPQKPTGFDQGKKVLESAQPQAEADPSHVVHDKLFRSGWVPVPASETGGNLAMRFPGYGEVRQDAETGMLKVPVEVFRHVRGDIEIPDGTIDISMEGAVAEEFLADLAALSNLRRMRGEAAFGGAEAELEAGGAWRTEDGEQHVIGIDGKHYARESEAEDWALRDPVAAREVSDNPAGKDQQTVRWGQLMATLRETVPDQPGIDQIEAALELLKRGDVESENIQQLTELLVTPFDESGIPNADQMAPQLTPEILNRFGDIVGRVATGNLSAEGGRVELAEVMISAPGWLPEKFDDPDPSKPEPPGAVEGKPVPEPDMEAQVDQMEVEEPAEFSERLSSSQEISGAVNWLAQPKEARREGARKFTEAAKAEGRQITPQLLRDTFGIPRETARDLISMTLEEADFEAKRIDQAAIEMDVHEANVKSLTKQRELAETPKKKARLQKRLDQAKKDLAKVAREVARSPEANARVRRNARRNRGGKEVIRDAAQQAIAGGGLKAEMEGRRKVGIVGFEKSAAVTDELLKMKVGGVGLVRAKGHYTAHTLAEMLFEEGYAGEEFLDPATGALDTGAIIEEFVNRPRGWFAVGDAEAVAKKELQEMEDELRDFAAAQEPDAGDEAAAPRAAEADYPPEVVSWAREQFGDRVAPNGKLVSENFVRWFGDSKVVTIKEFDAEDILVLDPKGTPLVVYHGTPAPGFAAFDPAKKGKGPSSGKDTGERSGFFFTSDPDVAHRFTSDDLSLSRESGGIMPVYLSMKNPLIVTAPVTPDPGDQMWMRGFIEDAQEKGHDGIIGKIEEQTAVFLDGPNPELNDPRGRDLDTIASDIGVAGDVSKIGFVRPLYIVFSPNQIKSTSNIGDFGADEATLTNGGGVPASFSRADEPRIVATKAEVGKQELAIEAGFKRRLKDATTTPEDILSEAPKWLRPKELAEDWASGKITSGQVVDKLLGRYRNPDTGEFDKDVPINELEDGSLELFLPEIDTEVVASDITHREVVSLAVEAAVKELDEARRVGGQKALGVVEYAGQGNFDRELREESIDGDLDIERDVSRELGVAIPEVATNTLAEKESLLDELTLLNHLATVGDVEVETLWHPEVEGDIVIRPGGYRTTSLSTILKEGGRMEVAAAAESIRMDRDEGPSEDPWDGMSPEAGFVIIPDFGGMWDWLKRTPPVVLLGRAIDNWYKIQQDRWDLWIRNQIDSLGIRSGSPEFATLAKEIAAQTRHHHGQAQKRYLVAAESLVRYREELGGVIEVNGIPTRTYVALLEGKLAPGDKDLLIPAAAAREIRDALNAALLYLHDRFVEGNILVMAPNESGQWTYQEPRARGRATMPRVWNREGRDRVLGDEELRMALWQQWVDANPEMKVGERTNPMTGEKTGGKPLTVEMLEGIYQKGSQKLGGPDAERRAAAEMARWIKNVPATFGEFDILEPDVWTAMNRIFDNQSARIAMHSRLGGDYPVQVRKRFDITAPGPTRFLMDFKKGLNTGSAELNEDIYRDAQGLFELLQGRDPEHVTAAMRLRQENSSVRRAIMVWMAGLHDVPALFGEAINMGGFIRMAKAWLAMYLPPKNRAIGAAIAMESGALHHEMGHIDLGEQRGPLAHLAETISAPSNFLEVEKTKFFAFFVKTELLDGWAKKDGGEGDVEMVMDLVGFSEPDARALVAGQADTDLQHRFLVEAVQVMASRGRPAERSRRASSTLHRLETPFTGWSTKRMWNMSREAIAFAKMFQMWGKEQPSLGRRARLFKRFISRAFGLSVQGQMGLFLYYIVADAVRLDWLDDIKLREPAGNIAVHALGRGMKRFFRDWSNFPKTMFIRGTLGQIAGGPVMVIGNAIFERSTNIAETMLMLHEPSQVAAGTARALQQFARGAVTARDASEFAYNLGESIVGLGEETGFVPRFFRAASVATVGYLGAEVGRWDSERRIINQFMRHANITSAFSEPQKQPEFYHAMSAVKDTIESHTGAMGDLWDKIQTDLNEALELQTGQTSAAKIRSFQLLSRFSREQRDAFREYRNDPDAYNTILVHDNMVAQLAEMVGRMEGSYPADWANELDMARVHAAAGGRNAWGAILRRTVAQMSRRIEAKQPLGIEYEDLADAMALHPDSLLMDNSLDGGYTLAIPNMAKPELRVFLMGVMSERAVKRIKARIKDEAMEALKR